MTLEVLGIDQEERWKRIVNSFKEHDVFQLPDYVKAFQIHGDGNPFLFYFEHKSTRGINVVMKRDIAYDSHFMNILPKDMYFDYSTPYGYGGFLVEGDDTDKLMKSYDEYCYDNRIISEFVRFHLFHENQKIYNGRIISKSKNVVRSLSQEIEEIRKEFDYKVRKNLNKAKSCGLRIEIDEKGLRMQDFLDIFRSTMIRNKAKSNYYFDKDFFKTLQKMEDHSIFFHVYNSEDKVIATELVVYGSEYCYSFLGGTLKEYYPLRPNDYLKYEIIKWAKQKGFKYFVLGGGYMPDDGIYQYKKSFAPEGVKEFYIGHKIFNPSLYNHLMELRQKIENIEEKIDYFPEYRA